MRCDSIAITTIDNPTVAVGPSGHSSNQATKDQDRHDWSSWLTCVGPGSFYPSPGGVGVSPIIFKDPCQLWGLFCKTDDVGGGRNPAQDKLLTSGDIKLLESKGYNVHDLKEEFTGDSRVSRYDLYKDAQGNVYVKPKGGAGAGVPVDVNLRDLG